MQKVLRTLMLAAAMLLPFVSQAQLSAIYDFTTGVDNSQWYTLTADSTVLKVGSGNDNYAAPVTNIGFTFTFAGVDYTQFSANSDGTVRLGSTVVGTNAYSTPFSVSNAGTNAPKICGLGCDGYLATGDYIAYQLFGTEGDHVLVIEISTGTYNNTTRNNHYTFQIQLAEADNSVTLVYSPVAPAAGPAVSYQLGASSSANDIVLFNVADNTMSIYNSGTGANNASGTWPAPGRYYTITPNPNACFPVTTLAASDITTDGAVLTWADTNNTGATYTIYNVTDSSVVATDLTAMTYTLTGLTANTAYRFAVYSNCSAENISNPATVNFRTACSLISLPWTCGFEEDEIQSTSQATALPWCSSRYVTAGATSGTSYPYAYSSSSYALNGIRSLYFYGATATSYPAEMAFILPQVDVQNFPMNGNRIIFWGRSSSTSYDKTVYIYTLSNPDDIATATPIDSVVVTGTTHARYSVSLTAAAPTDSYVAIMVKRGLGSTYLDDMSLEVIPSCLEVSGVTVSDATVNSLTLTWVANPGNASATYTIYDMADSSVVVSNVTGTTYTVTGLNANTSYVFGVQANCPAGDAPMTTASGRTECAAFDAPYTWNFDDMPANIVPYCWYKPGLGTVNVLNSTANAHSGSMYVRFSGSVNNVIVLPETEDEISTLQLRFWTRPESYTNSSCGTFSVGYVTNMDSVNSFVELAVYSYDEFSAYVEKTVNFVNAPAGARIAMRHNANSTSWYWYIDDVTIEEAPSCLPVSALTASDITENTATLSWIGNAAGYTIIDMADTSLVATISDTTYSLTGLTGMTMYTYGVIANCGSDNSDTVFVSFATACSAVSLPYTEDFGSNSASRGCWTLDAVGNIGGSNGAGFVTVNGHETFRFSSYSSASDYNQYGYSPLMNVSSNATNLQVSVVYATYNTSNVLNFGYITATDTIWDPTDYTTSGSSDWQTLNFVIPATATQLAVHYYGNYSFYAWIDSVSVSEVAAPVDSATITISVNDTALGTVTPDAGTYRLALGDTLIATATPIGDNIFNGWRTVVNGVTFATMPLNPLPFVANENNVHDTIELIAMFVAPNTDPDSVTIIVNSADTAMGTTSPVPGTYRVAVGDSIVFTSLPNEGYHNLYWVVDYTLLGMSVADTFAHDTVSYLANQVHADWTFTFTAYFEADPDSVVVTAMTVAPIHGTTTLNKVGYGELVNMPSYFEGDTIIATATPDSGYLFSYWVVTYDLNVFDTLFTNPLVMPVTASLAANQVIALMAHFESISGEQDSMTINLATADVTMGTTDPVPGTYRLALNDSIVVNAVANDGYHFLYWIRETQYAPGSQNYVDTLYLAYDSIYGQSWLLEANVTYTAYFEADSTPVIPDNVTVTFNVNDVSMGSISPSGVQEFAVGTPITITATPNDGYKLVAWRMEQNGLIIDIDEEVPTVITDTIDASWDGKIVTAIFEVSTGIGNIEDGNAIVYSVNSTIVVMGVENMDVNVYDVNGRCVRMQTAANGTVEFTMPSAGVYLVKVGNAPAKRVVVVR